MPPKAKFTREEVASAALEIIKREGIDALTARALGAELKSSARPIFTLFKDMEEVKDAAKKAAVDLYNAYENEFMNSPHPFKGSGLAYMHFAKEQPKLFQLLFMTELEEKPSVDNVLTLLDEGSTKIEDAVIAEYGVSREAAKRAYRHLWIYSHGIAVLLATKVCSFSDEQLADMLGEVGAGVIRKIKAEEK